MTKSLGMAYVTVSVLGEKPEQRNAAFKRLEALTVQIRQALAKRIRHQVRRIPELRFFLDDSQQHAVRIEELFAQIHAEKVDEGGEADGSEPAPDAAQ